MVVLYVPTAVNKPCCFIAEQYCRNNAEQCKLLQGCCLNIVIMCIVGPTIFCWSMQYCWSMQHCWTNNILLVHATLLDQQYFVGPCNILLVHAIFCWSMQHCWTNNILLAHAILLLTHDNNVVQAMFRQQHCKNL